MIIAGGGLRCGRQHAVEIGDDLHVGGGEREREREVEKEVGREGEREERE